MSQLDGRVALVTGGSRGIGAETARQLHGCGCMVVINARTADGPGGDVASQVDGAFFPADIAEPEQARMLVGLTAEQYGRLDILINCAGTTVVIAHDDLDAATPEIWHRLYATNVVAPWVLATAARPYLAEASHGVIINVGSLAGIKPGGSSVPYGVSKAALHQQTRMLAKALAPAIRVNAVAPSRADTGFIRGTEDALAAAVRAVPLGRLATPADVAGVILAQVLSPFVTGEVWRVDGGSGLVS
jgi:ketoreductase RED2